MIGRRYPIERIVLWLLVGAVLALAVGRSAEAGTYTLYQHRYTNQCQYSDGGSGNDFVRITTVNGVIGSGAVNGTYTFGLSGDNSAEITITVSGCPGSCSIHTNGNLAVSDYHGPGNATYSATIQSMPSGGSADVSEAVTTTTDGGVVCDNGAGTFNQDTWKITIGAVQCNDGVTVTAHWDGGAPHAADAVVNIVVGGVLAQVQCDAWGCNGATIPAAQLNILGRAPYNVEGGVDPHSWGICGPPGARYKSTVTNKGSWPTSVACGGTVDIPLDAHCTQPTPTPSPSASIAPSPGVTPSPSIVPSPSPSSTPLQFETPPPWSSPPAGMPGSDHASGTLTKGDIYDAVKQALDDAGTRDSEFGVPDGSFGFGSSTSGENGSAGNGLQSAVDRFTNDLSGGSDGLMGYVDSIDSLDLPTSIGDKSSWSFTLPVLGDINIDLSGFDTPVYAFRSLCLALGIVGTWFAMVKIIRSGIA
jgi:hypothetical protein